MKKKQKATDRIRVAGYPAAVHKDGQASCATGILHRSLQRSLQRSPSDLRNKLQVIRKEKKGILPDKNERKGDPDRILCPVRQVREI